MTSFLLNIGYNVAFLLSVILVIVILHNEWPEDKRLSQFFLGLLFGAVAVYSMATAYVYEPGIVFDSRTIVVLLAGLFGGSLTSVMTILIAVCYRAFVGGAGVLPGVVVILTSGLAGIVCRHWLLKRSWPPSLLQLWGIGVLTHLLVLGCMFLLPGPLPSQIIANTWVPFLIIFPIVVAGVGAILTREERWTFKASRLRNADELFNAAQELTRFGSWEYLVSTGQLVATDNFHRLLDIPLKVKVFSGQELLERIDSHDRDLVIQAFSAAITEKRSFDVQGRSAVGCGPRIWFRLVGKPVVVNGRVVRIVGNMIDITRRKTYELEIHSSREMLQAILDHTRALICICNLEGKVTLANKRFEVLDMQYPELVGRPLYELLPRDGVLEQWVDDLVALMAGEHVEFEEVLRHKDGTVHTYMANKFLLAASDSHPNSICYITTDITELRHTITERQILAEELKRKNTELEQFTYSVSHDLKAPLITVGSYANLLTDNLKTGRNELSPEFLEHICAAVDSMRGMIDGLLELSKVGRTVGEIAETGLAMVVEDAWLLLDGEHRNMAVQINIAEDLPTVYGDRLRLTQVMQNLLQNAIKFAEPNRPLSINVNWAKDADGGIVVFVQDNGRGIETEQLSRVFDLFVQGNEGISGSGVGLALVQRIMEKHGGSVSVDSSGRGCGSTFTLHFPAQNYQGEK